MGEVLTLYTVQRGLVLDALARDGVYRVKRAYVDQKYGEAAWTFQTAYGFFCREAAKYLPPPEGAQSPVWLYADPQWTDAPADGALLRVEAPRERALLFDLRDWNAVLNLSYLPDGAADGAAFQRELERQGVSNPLDLFRTGFYPQLKRRVTGSWERLFHPAGLSPTYTQAALWELRREWVTEIRGG